MLCVSIIVYIEETEYYNGNGKLIIFKASSIYIHFIF